MATSGLAIAFLDHDHVLELLESLLQWDDKSRHQSVRQFFSPEVVDDLVLAAVGEKVRTLGPLRVTTGPEAAKSADVVICRRGTMDASFIAGGSAPRLVQRLGSSSKGLDIGALRSAGTFVSLLPRRSLEHVADHVMMLTLSLARKVCELRPAMRRYAGAAGVPGDVAYNWPAITGFRPLDGLALGIVGYGEIGSRVARRAKAFGMKLMYTQRTRLDPAIEAREGLTYLPLDALLQTADVVSVHVPAAGLAKHLIGAREIALMKRDAYFINTSRGELVDQDALVAALRRGELGGAALDVFVAEPLEHESPLFDIPNLILTPHVAAGSRVDVLKELVCICDNIVAVMTGRPPLHANFSS